MWDVIKVQCWNSNRRRNIWYIFMCIFLTILTQYIFLFINWQKINLEKQHNILYIVKFSHISWCTLHFLCGIAYVLNAKEVLKHFYSRKSKIIFLCHMYFCTLQSSNKWNTQNTAKIILQETKWIFRIRMQTFLWIFFYNIKI